VGIYVALRITLTENALGILPASLGQEKQRAQGPFFLFKLFLPLCLSFTVFSPRGSVFWPWGHRFVTELELVEIGTEQNGLRRSNGAQQSGKTQQSGP
jgi:hypothetical protein